jgi:hypothetical protein
MAGGTDGNIISYDASGDPVAIATGSDGQVLTSTGAGSPPAFEDASSFDADAAQIFNDSGADVDFRIESNNNANAFFVDGGTDCVYFGANSSAAFDTFGAEISTQILGAGTAPYAGLGIVGHTNDTDAGVLILGKSRGTSVGSATIVQDGDQLGRISFQGMDGTDLETGADILAVVDGTPGANDMPAELIFRTTTDGNHYAAERLNIGADGDVTVSTGDLVFATAGKGVCLGVTSNTDANTLDDYEEGTWTPTLGGNTSYTIQSGKYTKVGRQVFASCVLSVDAIGTGSATTISGLPFTSSNVGGGNMGGSVFYMASLAVNVIAPTSYFGNGTSSVAFKSNTSAGSGISGNLSIFTNDTRVDFSITYEVS